MNWDDTRVLLAGEREKTLRGAARMLNLDQARSADGLRRSSTRFAGDVSRDRVPCAPQLFECRWMSVCFISGSRLPHLVPSR